MTRQTSDRPRLSWREQRAVKIGHQPLRDRNPFSDDRTSALKPFDQRHERMAISEDLGTLNRPRVHPGQPRRSLSLHNDQPQATRQRATISNAHKPSRTNSKLRRAAGIGARSQRPVKRVAPNCHPDTHPSRPIRAGHSRPARRPRPRDRRGLPLSDTALQLRDPVCRNQTLLLGRRRTRRPDFPAHLTRAYRPKPRRARISLSARGAHPIMGTSPCSQGQNAKAGIRVLESPAAKSGRRDAVDPNEGLDLQPGHRLRARRRCNPVLAIGARSAPSAQAQSRETSSVACALSSTA